MIFFYCSPFSPFSNCCLLNLKINISGSRAGEPEPDTEPGVFGSKEPEPEPLEKNQEPEPEPPGKKSQEPEPLKN